MVAVLKTEYPTPEYPEYPKPDYPTHDGYPTIYDMPWKEYDEYVKEYEVYTKGRTAKTEANLDVDLHLDMSAGILEEGKFSNCIINVCKPWSVKVWWRLSGKAREAICGYWCVTLHMESLGGGEEFSFPIKEIPLNPCGTHAYCTEIEGPKIDPTKCTRPYKLVVTLNYKTVCHKPGPIVGFAELPTVTFFESKMDYPGYEAGGGHH